MKKCGILILTVFYFLVVSGFAIHIHYCGGKLKEISFLKQEDCCCGSKKKTKGCCEEKTLGCKMQDNQKPASKVSLPFPVSNKQLVAVAVFIHFFNDQPDKTVEINIDHSPPDPCADPVFLLNRNFRI